MTTPTSKNDELVRQVRENARARYGDLDSEYVRMLKAKVPEAQDLWIIALNLADALEAAQEQARADEEAMRQVVSVIDEFHPERVCREVRGERFQCWQCSWRFVLKARLKAREGERKGDD